MRAVAYLVSYKKEEREFLDDLSMQKMRIELHSREHGFELGEIYVEENFSKQDFKPVLLRLINGLNGFAGASKTLILLNQQTLSNDSEFVLWVEEELSKVGVRIEYVMGTSVRVVPVADRKTHLGNLVKKIKAIPALSGVVGKMLEMINQENYSLAQLGELISYDVGLSSKVLKLVNSSYYGFEKRIGTIQHAITILGITTIKGLVLSSSVFKMVGKASGFDYKRLWTHNFLTAMGAKLIAQDLFIEQEEDLFSCAMMHDIGKFILASCDGVNYLRACELTNGSMDLLRNLEVEQLYCGTNHCEVGSMLAKAWGFPKEINDVILYHHEPALSRDHSVACALVQIADIISNMVILKEPIDFGYFDAELLEGLSISESNLASIYERLNLEIEGIDNFMEIFN